MGIWREGVREGGREGWRVGRIERERGRDRDRERDIIRILRLTPISLELGWKMQSIVRSLRHTYQRQVSNQAARI
jgi:hypothetical protein